MSQPENLQGIKLAERYLIESMEHTYDDIIRWWKPNKLGYTQFVDQAGRYSFAEAKNICDKAGPENERMWSESDVQNHRPGMMGIVCLRR